MNGFSLRDKSNIRTFKETVHKEIKHFVIDIVVTLQKSGPGIQDNRQTLL